MRRREPEHRGLRTLEWVFLLLGLIALDCYVWVNTSSVLYQVYQDWAFDQTLRDLKPSVPGFVHDEVSRLWGGEKPNAGMPPATAEAPKVSPGPPEAVWVPPAPESVIGRLEIPRLKLSVMVREGADEGTLARAVGHIPGTALPGQIGNVGLAGHRDTFFRVLRNIRADDTIEVQTTRGTYRYLVKSTKIVSPRDVSVLAASGGDTLTLVTCYPFYYVGSAPRRFIVHAQQIAAIQPQQQQPGS
ncbi:MAG TPA: sortase [Bryobacteraceae bacterium]|nr:sortase [Bryobacteraceae bacterium]